MVSVRRRTACAAAALMAVLLMICSFVGLAASAATSYIATFKEYQESGGAYDRWEYIADAMDDVFDASYELYTQGDLTTAYNAINDAYYGYYETTGFERTVMGAISGARVSAVELQFKTCKQVIKADSGADAVKAEIDTLKGMVREDAGILDGFLGGDDSGNGSRSNAVINFLSSFTIILREGIEAILVVGAIIAYLVKSGNKSKLRVVYLGCVLAIAASFLCAWLLTLFRVANSANQEVIEGVTALIAVLVLFYVSNWMVSKAEADEWNRYIGGQVQTSAETGSVFTLGFTAFLAVFREGAEVILFYQPMLSDAANAKYVWAGFGTGCVALAVIFIVIRFFSVKIPIKPFFLGTSILMFIMSISFLGAGIKELIEGDVVSAHSIPFLSIPVNDFFDVLGIYSLWETLLPQLILVLITLFIFVMQGWKQRTKTEAGVLAIIFGTFGIHKFYLGKYGQGLLYVAFCWTGLPTLIGILQGIHYLTESKEEFSESLKPKAKKAKEKKPANPMAKATAK